MSPAPGRLSASMMFGDIITNKWLLGLVLVVLTAEVWSHQVLPGLIAVEKARVAKAEGYYSEKTNLAKARLLSQQALVEVERGRNAAVLEQARAEAATAQADINRETLEVERQVALQAARVEKSRADQAQIEAALSRAANLVATGQRPTCLGCYIRSLR